MEKSELKAWVTVMVASLFFFFEFLQMNLFNAIGPELKLQFHLTQAQLGQFSASYFDVYIFCLIPAGIIIDRVSTKLLILVAMIAAVTGTFAISVSQTAIVAEIIRAAMGVGGAFCLLTCVTLASRWFPAQRMALVSALIVAIAMFGGVIAQTPFTYLVEQIHWRHALRINAIFGLVIIGLIVIFVRDYPPGSNHSTGEQHETLKNLGFFASLTSVFSRGQNWLAGLYTQLLNLPLVIWGSVFGIAYLHQVYGYSAIKASTVTTALFLGTIVGSPFLGKLSDSYRRRKVFMIWGAIISLAIVLMILFKENWNYPALLALFFGLGFSTSTQVISYPLVAESNPSYLTGTALGLTAAVIMSGYAIFQPLAGWLIDMFAGQPNPYFAAVSIIPVAFVVALIAALMSRETYCKTLEE